MRATNTQQENVLHINN